MPLLAALIGSMASGLASFFATWIGYQAAIKLAAYITWIAVFTAFFAAVFTCVNSLYQMMAQSGGGGGGGAGWASYFWMGLGMFIPQNASAVMGCVASVWISTSIWKIQRVGIENFSK